MARIRQTPTVASLLGSQMLGMIINMFFYGIGFILVLQYFRLHATNDPVYVKVMIAMLLTLATLQSIFIVHQAYDDYITNFGSTELFGKIIFSVPGKFICVYLTTFVAQIFFATRIWTLTSRIASRVRFVTIPIVSLALLQLIGGSILVALEAKSKDYRELATHTPLLIRSTAIQGSATAACDVVITATLCWVYHRYRSVSDKIDSTIDRLVIYAINRAAATSVCAILSVLLYYFVSGTYYFVIPCMMTGQLYVISAVSVLTSRESLREELDENSATKVDSANKFSDPTTGKDYSSSEKSV